MRRRWRIRIRERFVGKDGEGGGRWLCFRVVMAWWRCVSKGTI